MARFKRSICFICGTKVKVGPSRDRPKPNPGQKAVFQAWIVSCVHSISSAMNLSLDPSLGRTMRQLAKYCDACTMLIRDMDFIVQSLKRLKEDLTAKSAVLGGLIRANYEKLGCSTKGPVPGSYELELENLFKSLHERPESAVAEDGTDVMSLVHIKEEYLEECPRSQPVKARKKKPMKRRRTTATVDESTALELANDLVKEETPDNNVNNDEKLNDKVRFSRIGRKLPSDPSHIAVHSEDEDYCPSDVNLDDQSANQDETDDSNETDNEASIAWKGPEPGRGKKRPSKGTKAQPTKNRPTKKCPQAGCKFLYYRAEGLEIHTRKVHERDPKPRHCPFCPKKFASYNAFYYHKRTHTGIFCPCLHCGRKFADPHKLKMHNRKCTPTSSFPPPGSGRRQADEEFKSCTYEDCSFAGYGEALMVHVRSVHLGEVKPYACSLCAEEFKLRASYCMHMRKHAQGSPKHSCTFCPQVFWFPGELRKHIQLRHFVQETQNLQFTCPACLKLFDSEGTRDQHAELHAGSPNPFACVLCDLELTCFIDLKNHVRMEHEEGVPRCGICRKTFKTAKSLDTHVCGRKETNLNCPKCEYVGLSVKELTAHRLKEHGGNFMCSACGKLYLDKYSLKKHTRMHTGDFHLKCSLCPKAFKSYSEWMGHEQTHATTNSCFCPSCGKGFKTDKSVKQHLKSCRGNKKTKDPEVDQLEIIETMECPADPHDMMLF